jgi:hypothetical protein
MFKDVEVSETKRTIYFKDGAKATFTNVTSFNSSGSYLRLVSDEGYIIINSDNINYMIVPAEARVA